MSEMNKLADLMDCLKRLTKEQVVLAKHNAVATNFDNTAKRRSGANENARECAVEIRRLKHEAHCLAVEIGIADRREDSCYTPSTAPAGFGRDFIVDRRCPDAQRIDWLADKTQTVGNVQLPRECVEDNLHSLRDAIDCARRLTIFQGAAA